MQRFQILYNNFSGTTSANTIITGAATSTPDVITPAIGQSLQLKNNYYVYSSEVGGFTVNDNNVRNFLDDERNSDIAISFVNYIKDNTTISEFKEIFYNNKKLAAVFNEFYKNNILPGNQIFNEINNQIRSTSSENVNTSLFDENNNRVLNTQITLDSRTKENGYYIPIYVEQSKKLIDAGDYSEFFKDTIDDTYEYEKWYYQNILSNSITYGNSEFIKSIKNSETLGYSKLEDGALSNFSTGLQSFGTEFSYLDFNYKFKTMSQFEQFFKFKPPIIETPFPGFFISQTSITIVKTETNEFEISYNAILDDTSNLTSTVTRPTFVPYGLKFFQKEGSSVPLTIPIAIKLPSNAISDFTLNVNAEYYSTAQIETDFLLNDNHTNSSQIRIEAGSNMAIFEIKIYKEIQSDESIVLSLLAPGRNVFFSFLIIRGEETIPIDRYVQFPVLFAKKETKNKLMLNGFVDYNLDDNEMQYWHNDNVQIVQID